MTFTTRARQAARGGAAGLALALLATVTAADLGHRAAAAPTEAAAPAAPAAPTVPTAPTAPAAADAQPLVVDFGQDTGEFRGGASGTLYGFGDDGAPTPALVNGAHITNSSQKPPFGTQHPSGDVFEIEDDFFAKHGEDLYVYMQDYYPDWPYNGARRPGDDRTYDLEAGTWTAGANGTWDYLEVVEIVATRIAEDIQHPDDVVLIPFNEPDGIWYQDWGTMRDRFLQDWSDVHTLIRRIFRDAGHGDVRVGGPGDSAWHADRSADLLDHAEQRGQLPDVWIWHELGIDNLVTFRGNLAEYRALEDARGIADIPVNITEYGMLRDMGTPGQLIQWFSMFEDEKVDAQTAYWNYAGNFSDNSAGPNGANGGWWLFKWYGDLEGSRTVRVTPPSPGAVDSLRGIGALHEEDRRATVIYGGTGEDVALDLRGLDPAVFGDAVDVVVREVTLSGAEGLADTPRIVAAQDGVALQDGRLALTQGSYDRYAAYQVVVTPDQERDVEADLAAQPWSTSAEVEDLALTDAQAYTQDPKANGGWKFLASGGRDVGAFNRATSKADWTVEVPRDGVYRLQVIGATPGTPGRHALFVDGRHDQLLQYRADLALTTNHRWQYRGSTEVHVELAAGTHTLSIRGSRDGVNRLPNSDITLDKVLLTDATDGVSTTYPASGLRLYGGAGLGWDVAGAEGAASLAEGQRADLYVSAMESGYQDVTVRWRSTAASSVALRVNGRDLTTLTAPGAGDWTSTVRAHLPMGITEVELRSPGALVRDVTTTRVREADVARRTIGAEDLTLSGGPVVTRFADSTGSNASGGAGVGGLGNGASRHATLTRPDGVDTAGAYDLSVHYANAETVGQHAYNPQVVDRRLDVTETGTAGAGDLVGSEHFRYTYAWDSFWERTIHLDLARDGSDLVLGNPDSWAPDLDRLVLSPALLGDPVTTPDADVSAPPAATAAPRVTGTPVAGGLLRVSGGTWEGRDLRLVRQWLADGRVVAGATGPTLRLGAAHVGRRVAVRETATDARGRTATITSTATAPVRRAATSLRVLGPRQVTAGRPFVVRVVLRAPAGLTAAPVRVSLDGRGARSVRFRGGVAAVRLVARTPGRHRVVAVLPSGGALAGSRAAAWVVARR